MNISIKRNLTLSSTYKFLQPFRSFQESSSLKTHLILPFKTQTFQTTFQNLSLFLGIRRLKTPFQTQFRQSHNNSNNQKNNLKMSQITINLDKLAKVNVRGPATVETVSKIEELPLVPLGSKWENNQSTLLFIIRRLGCPVCRTAALLLSSVRPQLEAKGVKMICVTFQTGNELSEFISKGYYSGEIYVDTKKDAYEATETSGFFGAFKLIASFFSGLSPAFKERMKRLTSNNNEVTTVYSTIAGIKEGKLVFEQKYVEDPNIEALLKSYGIEGEDLKNGLDSVKMNLEAAGDDVVGPACSIKNRSCE